METLKEIINFINKSARWTEQINGSKLTIEEVKFLFETIDQKRKGYLDLADVYELVGDVKEEELFCIFKYLDHGKTGDIRLVDLETTLKTSVKRSSTLDKAFIFQHFYKVVDGVKDKQNTLDQLKKSTNFQIRRLEECYRYLCKKSHTSYLTIDDFIIILREEARQNGGQWSSECEIEGKLLFKCLSLNQKKFIELFSKQITDENNIKIQFQKENKTPSEVTNNSFQFYKPERYVKNRAFEQPQVEPIRKYYEEKMLKQPKLSQSKYTNSFKPCEQPSIQQSRFDRWRDSYQPKISIPTTSPEQKSRTSSDNQEISQVFKAIDKRREELKRDSLQRKKMIDQVMQRKKNTTGIFTPTFREESNWAERIQITSKEPTNNLKKSSNRAYLNDFSNQASNSRCEAPYKRNSYFDTQKQNLNCLSYERSNTNQREDAIYTEKKDNYAQNYQIQSRKYEHPIREQNWVYDLKQEVKNLGAQRSVGQILKKYGPFEKSEQGHQPCSRTSYIDEGKSIQRSQSGMLNPQSPINSYSFKQKDQVCEPGYLYQQDLPSHFKERTFNRDIHSNSLSKFNHSHISRENILKKAEEEAARKIEEIERKARMKVLEKRSGSNAKWNKEDISFTKKPRGFYL